MKRIHSHNSGMGIRGYHSQEFLGTGTGMKKRNMTIKEKCLANMCREKEFLPKHSQPHPPPFLIIPCLLVVVTATINEENQNRMGLFTITNTFAAKLFATKLSIMSCLFSHSLLNILAQFTSSLQLF